MPRFPSLSHKLIAATVDDVADEELEWYAEKKGADSKAYRKSLLPKKKKSVTQTVVEAITPKKVETVEEPVSEESSDEAVLADESE